MADSNNNNGDQPPRSDSNLPILFANGYPTSLKSMKIESLELFLPFLVECVADAEPENVPPKWWPKDLQFKFPLERPRRFKNNGLWETKLRDVVKACYMTSGNEYLLTYSENLSEIETDKLQLITDSNLTTSLFKKEKSGEKKLLITFRNENMTYDKRKRLQLWHKAQPSSLISPSPEPEESEATFQIILCDYCDSEFYSDQAFEDHESKCRDRMDYSDQEQDPEENVVDKIVISDDDDEVDAGSLENDMENTSSGGQANFMAYFCLANSKTMQLPKRSTRSLERSVSPKKRSRTRTRKVVNKKEIENERAIPFSSPAGQIILKKQRLDKEVDASSYAKRKYDELTTYCKAKPLMKIQPRSKIKQPVTENAVFREMKKPRHFSWGKRQLNSRSKDVNFLFLNRSLIAETVPATIVLNKLSKDDVNRIIERYRQRREEKKRREEANCIAVLDSDDSEDEEVNEDRNMPSTSGLGHQSFRNMIAQTNSISIEKRDSTTQIFSSNHEVSIISQTSQSRRTITTAPVTSQLSIQGLSSTYNHANSSTSSQDIENWLETVE